MCKRGDTFSLAILIGRGLDLLISYFPLLRYLPFVQFSGNNEYSNKRLSLTGNRYFIIFIIYKKRNRKDIRFLFSVFKYYSSAGNAVIFIIKHCGLSGSRRAHGAVKGYPDPVFAERLDNRVFTAVVIAYFN